MAGDDEGIDVEMRSLVDEAAEHHFLHNSKHSEQELSDKYRKSSQLSSQLQHRLISQEDFQIVRSIHIRPYHSTFSSSRSSIL